MEKRDYSSPDFEIVRLHLKDAICTSNPQTPQIPVVSGTEDDDFEF